MTVDYVAIAKAALKQRQSAVDTAQCHEKIETALAVGTCEKREKSELSQSTARTTWWRIYRDGEFLCVVMDPNGLTEQEAKRVAHLKWPDSDIEVAR